jgi:hypothetical protein
MEIDSQRFQIAPFLDKVVLRLWTNKFDPYDPDCPFVSPEDAESFCISDLMDEYGYIITTFPLEILHYYGYTYSKQGCLQGCFLTDYIFNEYDEYNINENDRYFGEFSPKMKDLLINKLGVKQLIK